VEIDFVFLLSLKTGFIKLNYFIDIRLSVVSLKICRLNANSGIWHISM